MSVFIFCDPVTNCKWQQFLYICILFAFNYDSSVYGKDQLILNIMWAKHKVSTYPA